MIRRRIASSRADEDARVKEFMMPNSESVPRPGRASLVVAVSILVLAGLYYFGLYFATQ
jgi:hypothetical protein